MTFRWTWSEPDRRARRALARAAQGLPLFAYPLRAPPADDGRAQYRYKRAIEARQEALRILYDNGLLKRSKKPGVPIVTGAGREALSMRRCNMYTERERETVRRYYKAYGSAALAERLGRTQRGVQSLWARDQCTTTTRDAA